MLKTNKTLESLSLETNKINGKKLRLIVQALEFNDTLKELRIANQVSVYTLHYGQIQKSALNT